MANKKISAMTAASDVQATDIFPMVRSGANYKTPASVLLDRANQTGTQTASTISDFSTASDARITAQAGQANGLATLDGGSKVPSNQLPSSVVGSLNYQGTWNATTNTPTLATGVGTKGYYYVVSTAGTTSIDGENVWSAKDWIVYNGTAWEKVDNTETVTSVNSATGAVVLTTAEIGENTNLYHTSERVDDRVAALIQNGTGISWTYDDASNTLTAAISLAAFTTANLSENTNLYYTDERVDDRVNALIQNGTGISWTYNDGANTLTANVSITQYTDEMAMDIVATMIQNGGGIAWTYNDGSNTLTPAITLLSAAAGTTAASKALIVDANKALDVLTVTALYARRPIVAVSGTTRTLALTDADTRQECSNGSAQTITIPPNSSVAFAVGTEIEFVQIGAGKVTLAQGAGVTISSISSNKSLSAQYAGATLYKQATDTWILIGSLIA